MSNVSAVFYVIRVVLFVAFDILTNKIHAVKYNKTRIIKHT